MRQIITYFIRAMIAFIALSFVLFLLMPAAFAQTPEQIEYFESQDGETVDQFVMSFAAAAARLGAENTAEVCGSIEQLPNGRYAMILGTNYSQLHCSVPNLWLNNPIGVIFHTHPKRQRDGTMHLTRATRNQMSTQTATVRLGVGFSDADFDAGIGYVVDGCDVLFQAGRDDVRTVGSICQ